MPRTFGWMRRCQECWNLQETGPPPVNTTERRMDQWLEQKCTKCKSPALDYGNEKRDPNEPEFDEESDQAFSATDHCVKWGCENAKLVKRDRFWICPKCESSYGENPHPDLK